MFGAKPCPRCGGLLRFDDVTGAFAAGQHVVSELFFWAAVILVLTFLYAPAGSGGLYLGLAAIAALAWLVLRPRQRARARALLARRQYCCAQCHRRFEGTDTHEIPSH